MRFLAPEGTELVDALPHGSVFQVARVRERDAIAVCKRLLPRVRSEPAGRAAIVREATALARARHPALPELIRVGSDGEGPFVIESYVPGASMRRLIAGWDERGSPGVPAPLVMHIAVAAAEALADVHELAGLGLSHGDIGPDHLLLGPIGEVRFIDFGAARYSGMDATLETGDKGTLPFVAPEVARGEATPGPVGDVYALAATILFLATGGAALVSTREEGAMLLEVGEHGIAAETCDRAHGLSAAGRDALRRALAFAPAGRLASARELAQALAG